MGIEAVRGVERLSIVEYLEATCVWQCESDWKEKGTTGEHSSSDSIGDMFELSPAFFVISVCVLVLLNLPPELFPSSKSVLPFRFEYRFLLNTHLSVFLMCSSVFISSIFSFSSSLLASSRLEFVVRLEILSDCKVSNESILLQEFNLFNFCNCASLCWNFFCRYSWKFDFASFLCLLFLRNG